MAEWAAFIISAATKVLGVAALFGKRWAYVGFVVLGLLYFPASSGFQFDARPCEWAFDLPLALHSFQNFPHIILFAIFFVMTSAQFRFDLGRRALILTFGMCLLMGLLVELAEGATGKGHCRMRDLIPDATGMLLGLGIVATFKFSKRLYERSVAARRN